MATSGKKRPNAKGPVFSTAAFRGFTMAAIAVAVLIIFVTRLGNGKDSLFHAARPNLTPIPTLTPSGSFTTSVPGNSRGSPSALVTVVEYADYQCVNCQAFALNTEPQLFSTYVATGKVRFVYKDAIIFGDASRLAAQAAEAAAAQNQFWPYHDLLYQLRASPEAGNGITLAKLQDLAQQAGLNMDTFNQAMASGQYAETVNQQDAEAKSLGVTGTPTFFINGSKLVGAQSLETFQSLIDQAISGATK